MTEELAYTLISSFSIFFLGIIVYFHNRKSVTNILFFFISLSTVAWAIANFFSLTVSSEEILLWIRLVLFFAVPHTVLFFAFIYNFPHERLVFNKKTFSAILFLLLITMVATISPYVFSDVEIINDVVVPQPGILMPLFAFVVLGSLVSALILMVRKYIAAQNTDKKRWRFMLIGTSLSYILLILTNFVFVILFQNTFFIIFGPLFMLPTFIGMSYAILRHQLLNIKAIAAEILTFVILLISFFEILIAEDILELVLRISVFSLFFVFGILLIRSVIKEVEAREEIEILAKDLTKANERLKELDQRKSEFVSLASHQLRSPLTAIKGYSSMLLEGSFGEISDKVKGAVDRVFESSNRLVIIIEDFLTISRIEQGRLKYNFASIDFKDLVGTMIKEMRPTIEKKGLAISFIFDENTSHMITADSGKIAQVVNNLIDNAFKYTPKGSITVRLEKDEQNHKIKFSVKDTGIGMSAEIKKKLFDKFTRADNASRVNVSGVGIGLFVVKQLIEAHHGKIGSESEGEGKGSTFFVELPAEE